MHDTDGKKLGSSSKSLRIQRRITQTERSECEYQWVEQHLRNRVTELECIDNIAQVVSRFDSSLPQVYEEIVKVLPSGLRYPNVIGWRIVVNGNEFKTKGYRESEQTQTADIVIKSSKAGTIQANYSKEGVETAQGRYPGHSICFIDLVAERIGKAIEHKRIQEELSKSEQLFRLLAENVPDMLFIYHYTPTEHFGYVSPASLAVVGVTPDEYYADPFLGHKIIHPDDLPRFQDWVKAYTVHNQPLIIRYVHKDGTIKWTEERPTPIFDEEGNVLSAVGIVRDITELKHAEEELIQSHNQLQQLSKYLQDVREEERTRIAREIHDDLGQSLTALKINLSWLASRLPQKQELAQKAESMSVMVSATIQTVKRISMNLRPSVLDDLGLAAAIEWLIGDFERTSGVKCRVVIEPPDAVFDRDVSTVVFRAAQEALTNILRHAGATRVWFLIKSNATHLKMSIVDNGRGISKAQACSPSSFGLVGMRERVRSLGGETQIKGTNNKGTAFVITIPLQKEGNSHADTTSG